MNRLVLGVVLAVVMASGSVFGQSTSITYQGQLKQAGVPVSGSVSLTFSLWDADVDGNLVAGPVNRPDTQVTNGLFNVLLDFPPEVFTGARLWLEVSVDGTPLTPRQEITPVPYALSVPGLAANAAGVEVSGDVHATGDVIASAFSSNSPLIFKVNPLDMECARFDDANCYLGLGTTAPQARLHIGGVAGVDGLMFPDGSMQTSAAGIGGGDGFWNANGAKIYNNNGGNVGIGKSDPLSKLDISASGEGAELLRFSTERPWLFRQVRTGPSAGLQLYSTVGLKAFEITTVEGNNVATFLADGVNSKVGIGTTLPASKLDIAATGNGAELLRFSTERPWVFRQIGSGSGAYLQLLSTVGIKLFEITAMGGTNVATFVADDANPRVGIGTTNPTSRLDIAGQDGLGITGFQPFLTLRDSNAGNARGRIQNAGGSLHFFTEASFATGIAPLSILNSGTTSVRVLEIRGGADLAEPFEVNAASDGANRQADADDRIEPGMVVVIDPANPGELKVSTEAYDHKVAGVISGAGGVNSGMIMGQKGTAAFGSHPVALTGRVYVYCDASEGAIAPGDLLTTSDMPGHAMKAVDRDRSHGAVIGKAMSSLATGPGLVLVLVNLQ